MSPEKKGRSDFPFYLSPGPDQKILRWLGSHLQILRGKKSVNTVAQSCRVPVAIVNEIEEGIFHVDLGLLREIALFGYGIPLGDLLSKCYKENRQHFDPKMNRSFERHHHYWASTRKDENEVLAPYFLIGGNPKSFVWAVPMCRLKGQNIATELLELAPLRKRNLEGATPDYFHNGTEVIFVIHGSILAHIAGDGEGDSPNSRVLKAGDWVHFLSREAHHFENLEKTTSALLLVIRAPVLGGPNITA